MNATRKYPVTLVTMRDCHASHNETVTVYNSFEESQIRRYARRHGMLVAVRKGGAK